MPIETDTVIEDDGMPPGHLSNQGIADQLDKELAATRDDLKAKLDAEDEFREPEPEIKPDEKPEERPEETDEEKEARLRDEKGRFVAKPREGEEPAKEEPSKEPDTPYAKASRAEKDAARLARVVEQRQAEAEQLAQERDEWRARAEQAAQPGRREEQTRFNSDQFARAADEFAQKGFEALKEDDTEAALEAFNWAKKAQASANEAFQAEQGQAVAAEQEGFIRTWGETVQDVIAEAKEVGIDLNDETGEASKAIVQILDNEPILNYLPDGFRKTWELYQLRMAYAEAPALKARIAELEKELGRFVKVSTPSSGSRSRPSGKKSFDQMTMAEQREYLKAKQFE